MARITTRYIDWLLDPNPSKKKDFKGARDFAGYFEHGMPFGDPFPIAKVSLPDDIYLIQSDDCIKDNDLPDVIRKQDNKLPKNYSFWIIKINFVIHPISNKGINWHTFFSELRCINLDVKIKNIDQHTPIFIYNIFPKSKSIRIGKQTKEYSILADLSIKSQITSPIIKIIPQFEGKSKVIRNEEYDLMVPECKSSHNGNTEAYWTFFLDRSKPNSQYRVDIIAAFPNNNSTGYKVEMNLSSKTKSYYNTKELIHEANLIMDK